MSTGQTPAPKKNWLDPYSSDATVKAAIAIFLFALLALIMARAPEIAIRKAFGFELPFEVNAIVAILAGPPLLAIGTWLLSRSALNVEPGSWRHGDIVFATTIFAALGIVSIALWLQFFIVIAPVGECDTLPRFNLFWTNLQGPTQVEHCMSTGRSLKSWHYVKLVWLQAWLNTLLTALSLLFTYTAWRSWKSKRRPV